MAVEVGEASTSVPRPFGLPCESSIERARLTAASELMSPAPCSSAGAPRSVAVLMMICLTSAGDGSTPRWVLRYAWITRAASPAVSGEDSLVPPNTSMGDGLPLKSLHSWNRSVFVEHSDQPESPGATTSTVRALCCAKPAELNADRLLLMNPFFGVSGMAPSFV